MTKAVQLSSVPLLEDKGGQLSWLLDGVLITAAILGVFLAVLGGAAWTHRAFAAIRVSEAAASDRPAGAPLLWVVKEGDATVYLFGSAGDRAVLDQRVFTAFDNASAAWFETPYFADLPATANGSADLALYRRAGDLRIARAALDEERVGFTPGQGLSVPQQAWLSGNEQAMTAAVAAEAKADPDAYDALQVRRVRKWLPQVERALTGKGTVFLTVSAAHLFGSDGLVSQLRAHGHTVTRLDPR